MSFSLDTLRIFLVSGIPWDIERSTLSTLYLALYAIKPGLSRLIFPVVAKISDLAGVAYESRDLELLDYFVDRVRIGRD